MTFTQAIKSGFSNYVNFTGRAARSEFWYWVLFAFLVGIAADVVDYVVGSGSGLVSELWGLATILPNLAVGARRLHDRSFRLLAASSADACGRFRADRFLVLQGHARVQQVRPRSAGGIAEHLAAA